MISRGLLRAGTGRADITPGVPFPMGGWSNQRHELSRANHRRLTATAVCLANDEHPMVILMSLDLCILTTGQATRIRAAVAEATGLGVGQVVVSVSHSHASPVTSELTGLWQRTGREAVAGYVDTIVTACVQAACSAARSTQVVRSRAALGWCDLAVNRRSIAADGALRVGFNPDGPAVRTVPAIRFDTADGDAVAVIWSYAAHPIILSGDNDSISPEFPGVARDILETLFPGALSLFLQGASGDVTVREALTTDTDVCERAGLELGYAAASAVVKASTRALRPVPRSDQEQGHWLTEHDLVPVVHDVTEFRLLESSARLPLREHPTDAARLWAEAWVAEDDLARVKHDDADPVIIRANVVETKRKFMLAEQATALVGQKEYDAPLVFLRLNDAAIVLADVEMFATTGLAVAAESPFPVTILAGHTNGYRNYLPTDEARDHGGYEVDFSPFSRGSEQIFRAAVLRGLQALSDVPAADSFEEHVR